jgi:hypothetical protein
MVNPETRTWVEDYTDKLVKQKQTEQSDSAKPLDLSMQDVKEYLSQFSQLSYPSLSCGGTEEKSPPHSKSNSPPLSAPGLSPLGDCPFSSQPFVCLCEPPVAPPPESPTLALQSLITFDAPVLPSPSLPCVVKKRLKQTHAEIVDARAAESVLKAEKGKQQLLRKEASERLKLEKVARKKGAPPAPAVVVALNPGLTTQTCPTPGSHPSSPPPA